MSVGTLPIVVTTDLDGDGAEETVTLGTDGSTEVSRNGAVLWRTTGAIDGWNRSPSDDLLSVGIDINSDGKDEVVIYNQPDGWTGVLAWNGSALTVLWASGSPIQGNGNWNRRGDDGFAATSFRGVPAIGIGHIEDGWFGFLTWQGGQLRVAQIFHGEPVVVKWTYLADDVIIDGQVAASNDPNNPYRPDPYGDSFDLKVDGPFLPLAATVSRGGSAVKCETYPIIFDDTGGHVDVSIGDVGGISITWFVTSAEPNHVEPWPLPMKPDADRFVYPGSGQPVRADDHIRLRGQLFIENGHPQGGSPWIELHPFDYTRITKLGDIISSGDFTLVAPLYSRATYVPTNVGGVATYSGVVEGETYAPDIPVAFAGHQPVTLRLTHPVPASGPALTYTERILENTTGQPADSIRHIQFDPATGVLVVTGSLVTGDDLTAPLFNQRRAFRARYIIGQRPEQPPAQADRLTANEGLAVGGSLRSPNGFVLALQADGNLVVYAQHGLPLWASNTAGHTDVWYLQMEPDGNLVLHDQNDLAMWTSGTDGHPGASAVMLDDGDFVINDAAGSPLWATDTVVPPQPPPPARGDRLQPGEGLIFGGTLVSGDGRFTVILQADGNLVLYAPGTKPLWASNTADPTVWDAVMQSDGNLVVYNRDQVPLFATGTDGHPGAWAIIQNDGNFVVYDAASKPLWATNTAVVDVPNVIGQSPDAASATLQAAGLQRQIVEVRQGGERPTVVGQSPMANTLVAPGTTVDLTVEDPKTGPQP
jgi:PASTA domain